MYFVNSVAYNGVEGAQSREGHLNSAAKVGIGKVDRRCDHESLFVHKTVDRSRAQIGGFLE
jgi:hypothetical protein